MKYLVLLPFLACVFLFSNSTVKKKDKPKICFTFDDGNISDVPGYRSEEWNQLLLKKLRKNQVQAVLFAMGAALDNTKGKAVLQAWSEDGHWIANHTYSHKSYHSAESTFETFRSDFIRNDSLIKNYQGYQKWFRFPYLKEGDTQEKREAFRQFMKEQGYRNGYVTIDASDWFINSRLLARLKQNPKSNIEGYRQFYLDHIWERANYYNDLSLQLTGRQISHSLLLHHNLTSALFVDDLIRMFHAKGWEVIDAREAYEDEIYTRHPDIVPAGQSLVWALAKEKGTYDSLLRYPAEDSQYEEPKMNKLGL